MVEAFIAKVGSCAGPVDDADIGITADDHDPTLIFSHHFGHSVVEVIIVCDFDIVYERTSY